MKAPKWIAALVVAAACTVAGTGCATAPASASMCTVTNSSCGPYDYSSIPMSNGYNTYVEAQQVGPNSGTSDTVSVNDPGSWSDKADAVPYGYTGVQMFDNIQQLTNDWNGSGWGGGAADTPISSLSSLSVTYSETSPTDASSIYEFAPDIWTNYSSDVMMWADTSPKRCTDNGMDSSNIIGQATIAGQNWTVYRYGDVGSEIIFILDGSSSTDPVSTGTCAQQKSGTVDIKAGLDWLNSHGVISGPMTMSQLNTGWEITSADNTTFTVSSYAINATVNGSTPTPTPTPTTATPTPTTPTPTATSGETLVGVNAVKSSVDMNPQGTAEAFQYTAQDTGDSQTIDFYVDSSDITANGYLGIYDAGINGDPGKLLKQVPFKPKAGWNSVTLTGVNIIGGTNYWLAELGTDGALSFRDEGSGTSYSETINGLSSLPANWGSGTRWYSGQASFYVSG